MFTGIITDVGIIRNIEAKPHIHTIEIECGFDVDLVNLGASISCNGVCLTVTAKEKNDSKVKLLFDLSPETLSKTTYKNAKIGDLVNLERSLKVGDELGGHLVSGHVDFVAEVSDIEKDIDNWIVKFKIPAEFSKFVSEKGSVTINGISLTINKIIGTEFEINVIPHTLKHTNFHTLKISDKVNIEVDMIARYLSSLIKSESLK